MPNIASALKAEIQRIARKTIRDETSSLRRAIAPYRSEIAALKRRTQVLEQQLRRSRKAVSRVEASPQGEQEPSGVRFSAKGLAKNRQRLGLSAADFGTLIGASGQSVYKWEEGKSRPRQKNLAAIAAIRSIGKKDAQARLQQAG
ncbi:helix-turn-helix domain-containing protein [Caenimonas terrae]|uniref:Helix-turn-helix domain-containing protein n=1 Tax=Caenimonas terrae TaxID=696074 RepID=A0ABW0NME1_9BURK